MKHFPKSIACSIYLLAVICVPTFLHGTLKPDISDEGEVSAINQHLAASQFQITINSVHGTVTKNPNQTLFDSNTVVTLTAVPSSGFRFTSWSGDVTSTANPLSGPISKNLNITTHFSLVQNAPVVTYRISSQWI